MSAISAPQTVTFYPTMQYPPDERCVYCFEGFLERSNVVAHAAQNAPLRDIHFFHRECCVAMLTINSRCGLCVTTPATLANPSEQEISGLAVGVLAEQNRRREALMQVARPILAAVALNFGLLAIAYCPDDRIIRIGLLIFITLFTARSIMNFFSERNQR